MESLDRLKVIDVRNIVKSPYQDLVWNGHPAWDYLMESLPRRCQDALNAGEDDPNVLNIHRLTDVVELEVRRAVAARRPNWTMLNWRLWSFLANSAPAARDNIPQVLDEVQQTLLKNEWFELMSHFQTVRQHVETTISIQRYPKRK